MLTILDAIRDPQLFAPWFRDSGTWQAWLAFLATLFALPLDAEAAAIFRKHTGREALPAKPFREAWLVKGRRGGGTFISSLVSTYLAAFRDYSDVLTPGERGTLMLLAADRRQARTAMRYIGGFFDQVPMLAALVESRTVESINLRNGITLEVHTASFRTVRGYTLVGVVCDEIAFWRSDESANPDSEVLAALRPGLLTVPGALLLGVSSPYSRRGVLYDAYRRYWGKDDEEILVWQGDTLSMNPSVDRRVIERAYIEDEAAAQAEYGAEFRRDIEAFLTREALEAVVVPGRRELGPIEGQRYLGFCDPSGGSSDSMTLAIAHKENGSAVLDAVREARPPFSPEAVVEDFAEVLRRFRVSRVTGDRYGAEWVGERFRQAGITYKPAQKPKSDLYRELLPAIHSQTVELLDLPKLMAQLCQLERRTARGGRDSIDHPPRGHDDLANAVAGAVHLVLRRSRGVSPDELYGSGSAEAAI